MRLPFAAPLHKRDMTVALVGFTSWTAVSWKLSQSPMAGPRMAEVLLAATAALACLWPIPLGLVSRSAYPRWREWLVPVHHAVQHWIGVHFALPQKAPPLLATPAWARSMLPIFLATFCQPWLYLAFGACLQRTRLRTFLWSQPLLLAPVFFVGRTHCANHLTATPEAAKHLQHIAVAMQRCSSWLPVAPVLAEAPMLATAAGSSLSSAEGACLGVHFWLVVILAYGLPAIVIHRLEGQEEHTRLQARKQQQQRGHQSAAADNATAERDLLLQRRPTAIHSAAELFLAGYAAWLLAQLALPLFH